MPDKSDELELRAVVRLYDIPSVGTNGGIGIFRGRNSKTSIGTKGKKVSRVRTRGIVSHNAIFNGRNIHEAAKGIEEPGADCAAIYAKEIWRNGNQRVYDWFLIHDNNVYIIVTWRMLTNEGPQPAVRIHHGKMVYFLRKLKVNVSDFKVAHRRAKRA